MTFDSVNWEELRDTLALKISANSSSENNTRATAEHGRCSGDGTRLKTPHVQTAKYGNKMQII